MRGTLRLFTWLRIPVYLHWTFGLLILLLAGWTIYTDGFNPLSLALQLGLMAILFGCVLLHEYGHSLAARRYGIETADIILTPIGGIARLERMPDNPRQELVVAIAGPLVNVAIALLLWVLCYFWLFADEARQVYFTEYMSNLARIGDSEMDTEGLALELGLRETILMLSVPIVLWLNVMMVLFNLIPAFPMDGGRIFRALLSMKLGRVNATFWAARLGQVFAVLFVIYGVYSGAFTLALIGFFVFNTAQGEYRMVRLEFSLQQSAKEAMTPIRPEVMVQANDWMQIPIQTAQQTGIRSFLVFDMENTLCGSLSERALNNAISRKATASPVADFMQRDVDILKEDEPLHYVHYLLVQQRKGIVAIINEAGELSGTLDVRRLAEFVKEQISSKGTN
jgi:Zn-dependent protease/predicted transcriptional regulator